MVLPLLLSSWAWNIVIEIIRARCSRLFSAQRREEIAAVIHKIMGKTTRRQSVLSPLLLFQSYLPKCPLSPLPLFSDMVYCAVERKGARTTKRRIRRVWMGGEERGVGYLLCHCVPSIEKEGGLFFPNDIEVYDRVPNLLFLQHLKIFSPPLFQEKKLLPCLAAGNCSAASDINIWWRKKGERDPFLYCS